MAEVKHYDLGDAVARIVVQAPGEGLPAVPFALVQLDSPSGVVRLNPSQFGRLIEAMIDARMLVATSAPAVCGHEAEIARLKGAVEDAEQLLREEAKHHQNCISDLAVAHEKLAQAHADNDLAQAEIARLTEKPKRQRKPKADEPPADWDAVPAEPPTDLGAQGHGDNVWETGEWVEVIATGARAQVDRVFPDNPSKVQVLLGGSLPKVFDVSALRKAEAPAPEPSDVLDVEELIDGLEAVGLPVFTDVPTVAPSVLTVGTDEAEVVTTQLDPERLRRALYEDSKLYEFTPDDMKALIAEVVGEPKSSKELDAQQLSAVLREMHDRGRKARMPF
jgi:hypothetical protein